MSLCLIEIGKTTIIEVTANFLKRWSSVSLQWCVFHASLTHSVTSVLALFELDGTRSKNLAVTLA